MDEKGRGGRGEGVRKQLTQTGNKSKVEEADKCKCRKNGFDQYLTLVRNMPRETKTTKQQSVTKLNAVQHGTK